GCFGQLPLKALRLFYSSVRFNFTIYHIITVVQVVKLLINIIEIQITNGITSSQMGIWPLV
ncbi:hypothetical protein, partial [Leuconostoc pseudomesenteroides]|uniref:hypothetical protein n=1 Tax=Leuconostoc pseudomesenteroides TaxID=33968 RepID=UPI00301B7B4B